MVSSAPDQIKAFERCDQPAQTCFLRPLPVAFFVPRAALSIASSAEEVAKRLNQGEQTGGHCVVRGEGKEAETYVCACGRAFEVAHP